MDHTSPCTGTYVDPVVGEGGPGWGVFIAGRLVSIFTSRSRALGLLELLDVPVRQASS